jgi:hypothetical protein
MIITYKTNGTKYPKLVTPCPHSFGWISHGVWGLGAKSPVMVGSSICELDCPHNGGVNKLYKQCTCNKN